MSTLIVSTAIALALSGSCTPAWSEPAVVSPAIPGAPAVGAPTVTVDNPDYIPAVPSIPAVPEVSHVEHVPAVGEPTIVVPNPAYVPAQHHDGTPDRTIHHDAVVVHHDAVVHTEWKYVQHGGNGVLWVGNDDAKYVDAQGHGLAEKPRHGVFYERTQDTRTVTDCAAWDEVVSKAWDEVIPGEPAYDTSAVGEPTITIPNPAYQPAHDITVIDQAAQPAVPGVPAVGEPTLTISNPAYIPALAPVPAVTATVEHAAVCTPAAQVRIPARVEKVALAETGTDPLLVWGAGGIGIAALALGAGLIAARRHVKKEA